MHTVHDSGFISGAPILIRTQTTFTATCLTFVSLQVTQAGGLSRITVQAASRPEMCWARAELMGPNGWYEIWRLDHNNMKTRFADAWKADEHYEIGFINPGLEFWEADRDLLSGIAAQVYATRCEMGVR